MKRPDVESISSQVDWKQFEALAKSAFESFGYRVEKNYRLKKPRMEIDLLATRNGKGFATDCKHWKRSAGKAAMESVANRQIDRAKRLIEHEGFKEIVPLIITWREEPVTVLENGVPVVPIRKFSDFMLNFETSPEEILVLKCAGPPR